MLDAAADSSQSASTVAPVKASATYKREKARPERTEQ